MSIAKQTKMKEYGTDILSHDATVSGGYDNRVRFNNTFKSSVMPMDESSNGNANGDNKSAKIRDKIFKERPLTAKVQRASY